jgi:uncharacterized membrane protein
MAWNCILTGLLVAAFAVLAILPGAGLAALAVIKKDSGLALGFGLLALLFVVVGVYVLYRCCFAVLLTMDKGLKPMDAVKASLELTEGMDWFITVFGLLAIGLCALGLLALGVGILPAAAVSLLAFYRIYLDRTDNPAS